MLPSTTYPSWAALHLVYYNEDYIVLDFETTNLDKGDAHNPDNAIVCASWYFKGVYKHIAGNQYQMGDLIKDVEQASFIISQNAKFELKWLLRCGVDISRLIVWDTMLAEYVFAGNRSFELNLEAICARHGIQAKSSWIADAIKAGICPSVLPIKDVVGYCDEDVMAEHYLFLSQLAKYQNLVPIIYARCYLTPALADIERNGMHVDAERVTTAVTEVSAKREEVRVALEELTGGINPRSPKQVAAFLYDVLKFKVPTGHRGEELLTPSGNRPTDTKIISKLAAKTERQRKFLDLKKRQGKLDAEWSKCVHPLARCVEETKDHVLRAVFNQAITQTQRLSSSGLKYGVQFQNFPRDRKDLFNARDPANFIVEADAAQLEFRVAAFEGQDEVAISDIVNDVDIHSFTAAELNNVSYEWMLANKKTDPVAKEYRQDAKASTFKPIYGGQSGTEEEKRYYAAFKQKYKGIAAVQQKWVDTVLRTKKLTTSTGFVFYWPDTTMSKSGYVSNTTQIYNYPIQQLATADIIPLAVGWLWRKMKELRMEAFIINTVHDSIVAEVPAHEVELFSKLADEAISIQAVQLLKAIFDIDFNVPLATEIKTSRHWGE